MADNVDEHAGLFKNSSNDGRFLQIEEIQYMHLLYSASFDTNNDKNDVNEARIENVDKFCQSNVWWKHSGCVSDFIAKSIADAKFIVYPESVSAKYKQ